MTAQGQASGVGDVAHWEKTVEYSFIAQAATAGLFDWAMPLSWIPETGAGDVVLNAADRYILIEFKKSIGELDAEERKYRETKGFEDAARDLLPEYAPCHYFVFADLIHGAEGVAAVAVQVEMANASLEAKLLAIGERLERRPADAASMAEALSQLAEAREGAAELARSATAAVVQANCPREATLGLVAVEYFLANGKRIHPAIDILRAVVASGGSGTRDEDAMQTAADIAKPVKRSSWISRCEAAGRLQPGLEIEEFEGYLKRLRHHRKNNSDSQAAWERRHEAVMGIDVQGRIVACMDMVAFLNRPAPAKKNTAKHSP